MSELDKKINQVFAGYVVRKDLTKIVKGNAIVPSYVLEYLLGQYCATDDEATIQSGIETVKGILSKHYVHRSEAGLIRSTIEMKGRHKVIDKISAELNDKGGYYEALFTNLGLKRVEISKEYIKKHPKLLVGGVWCIADMQYQPSEDPDREPWHIDSLKPIQVSNFDYDHYINARKQFTTDEWIDVLIQSIGLNPEMLGRRAKLLQLIRLVPYCERNYNMIELGPKGTGKSHIFSEFSPHGILISGGDITIPKLFVNNASGKIGLVGFWDSVAFDEFAGKDKKVDKGLVDIMKNYMANKTFSRGIEMMGAEASMVFLGNTRKSVAYMMKHSHFFDDLPDKYIDTAFLDRLHFYNPGWESSIIRAELFTNGYGFIVDYLAEILRKMRTEDYSNHFKTYFSITQNISTRDRDGVLKTFSGLMKILFPEGKCTKEEMREVLAFAMEGRKRVKDQILKIDDTFEPVKFSFIDLETNKEEFVTTLEETQYPSLARRPPVDDKPDESQPTISDSIQNKEASERQNNEHLEAGKHVVINENEKGHSYRSLFGSYLKGAKQITVSDPYIRHYYQVKNMMEFLQMVHAQTPVGDEVVVKLVTKSDKEKCADQDAQLKRVEESFTGSRVSFSYEYDNSDAFHARSIITDTGWKISIDRGLDIFQRYDIDTLSLTSNVQEERLCKPVEVTFLRVAPN